MTTIFKYSLQISDDVQEIEMPGGAEILSVQFQKASAAETRSIIAMWARCNDERSKVFRKFICCGTGGPAPEWNNKHIGTVIAGMYVWHFFELL